jgi:dihydrofolate reductase
MSRVIVDISMTLDGLIAGPDDDEENGLGIGGDRIHAWIYGIESWRRMHGMEGGENNVDSGVLAETFANNGAVLMGRRMYNLGLPHWGEEPPFHMPVFVLTHEELAPISRQGGTVFNFVTDHAAAVARAKASAGDKDVYLAGGASIIQQALRAGLVDEMQLHVVPVLLGGGRPLFAPDTTGQIELEPIRTVHSPAATHIRYRVLK